MRVGIIQSSYIPWRGYFDFISQVDLFLLFDDVQIGSARSWRSRNAIKTPDGLKWLSVPLKGHSRTQLIMDTAIDELAPWRDDHLGRFSAAYRACPFFQDAFGLLEHGLQSARGSLSQLNSRLIDLVCDYLGIRTPRRQAAELGATGTKSERLLDLLRKAKASSYLSGPAARDYLDEALFREAGIGLEYKSYDYAPYPQPWGAFEGAVTVLDLIANCGPGSRALLASTTLNVVAHTA